MAAVITAAIFWALGGALAGRMLASIPAEMLIALRFEGSLLLLLPVFLVRPPLRSEWALLVPAGILLTLVQGLYYLVMARSSVATVLFLEYLAPVILTIYAMLRGQKIGRRTVGGVAIAVLGAYLLVIGPRGLAGSTGIFLVGLVLGGTLAIYAELNSRIKTPPFTTLAAGTVVGTLLSSPVWFFEKPSLSTGEWVGLAYIVVFSTIIPFALFLRGLQQIPARLATLLAMLEPVAGSLLAIPIAHQPLSAFGLLGGGLILLGVWLNALQTRPSKS